ncbi:hypothetical protein CAEBREN_31139 [Caenorhabditis brenneri]|uniref:Myosin motor domain-containing protein n=1 Tax=Caenorhabditis brenneri TaxID=135651 RepID=G0P324_CAEBE|nr:hypothetical protein CAEBREN_31139 [Caenorhabditis brenneri]
MLDSLDNSIVRLFSEVDNIAELLEMKNSKLVDALTQPTIKVHDKLIRKNQNLGKTLSSASAMAKVLYERLFGSVVKRCNDAFSVDDTSSSCRNSRFIAVLDIAGFEIIEKNSFEQFCINYTNEKLQQFFNHFMFVKEQSDYLEEGIKWTQVNFANHLQPTIDLIEKPMGVLSFLEEECVVPNGSEKSLLEKLCSNLSTDSSFKKSKQSQKCSTIRHFAVQHYAGEVHYNIDGWLEKNRDNVETSVLDILSQSTHPLLKVLFPPVPANNIKARRGTITNSTVSFLYKLLDREKTEKIKVQNEMEEVERKGREKLLEKEREFRKTMEEMEQNEEIFSVLEKKYNDQHKKVMKMNDILRDYERKIEQLNMEKTDLETENLKLKEAQNRQDSHYSNLEKELLEKTSQIDDLQNQVQKLLDETNEQRITIAKLETALEDEKSRFTRQNNTIGDMQKLITELNEKESLQTTVRKQTSQLQETTRQFNSAQKNADNLALRLKKALADCDEWKKKHEESIKESKTEILLERKRAMDRAEASEKETELKQSRMATIESAKTALSGELGRTQAELDRCRQIIQQLEENLKSQETLGNSFERHQSNLNFEIENLRDENCALKAKIRRQYKQIELLTQQDETNDELNHFENKTERLL